ncbi:D-methionine transport system permease protein [Pasteurella testudinis DSM 23072]|uniref:Probable D-methionine transport system permease protein MetI n=1 Tax=Pasteurella testudinis DSM 23072 TaxID=1122938 RepID=A0A1W1UR11_9PAST|nr:methionine ABC transporter permease [Pasteurella testudinis]SMB83473.1 D-methionine transport system permease protein [Pasteurella testudinis DSM 23072]SUB51081.1 D-methionine transport system permease protein MetI [Pasteurella testudinis]
MFDRLTPQVWQMILNATGETLYMVFASGFLAALFAIPLGVLLFITRPGEIKQNPKLYRIISVAVNIGRAIPFVILLFWIIPFTRALVGSSIGTTAAVVPLTVAAIPFVARLVEGALLEIPAGLTEAARAMGATNLQIIGKFLLPEALPALINGLTITLVTLVNYSAMAGIVGGGGLGDVAIRYGYQTNVPEILTTVVIILVAMVQLIQFVGDSLVRYVDHR